MIKFYVSALTSTPPTSAPSNSISSFTSYKTNPDSMKPTTAINTKSTAIGQSTTESTVRATQSSQSNLSHIGPTDAINQSKTTTSSVTTSHNSNQSNISIHGTSIQNLMSSSTSTLSTASSLYSQSTSISTPKITTMLMSTLTVPVSSNSNKTSPNTTKPSETHSTDVVDVDNVQTEFMCSSSSIVYVENSLYIASPDYGSSNYPLNKNCSLQIQCPAATVSTPLIIKLKVLSHTLFKITKTITITIIREAKVSTHRPRLQSIPRYFRGNPFLYNNRVYHWGLTRVE